MDIHSFPIIITNKLIGLIDDIKVTIVGYFFYLSIDFYYITSFK